jgi:hypothetical protein
MEAQRGEQGDDAARDALGDVGQRVPGGVVVIARRVDTAGVTRDLALAEKLVHPPARDTIRLDLGRPDDAEAANDVERLAFSNSWHRPNDTKRRGL